VTRVRELGCETVHYAWDNALPPRLEIDSGETVRFTCRDAFDGVYSRESTAVIKRVAKGHPLTGPVAVRGAQQRDVLQFDVLDLVPGAFGVTTFVPDRGVEAGGPRDDRAPRRRVRAHARGGLRPVQRGRGPEDQRGRRRAELGRERVPADEPLRLAPLVA
jgi:hypothetical protein